METKIGKVRVVKAKRKRRKERSRKGMKEEESKEKEKLYERETSGSKEDSRRMGDIK